MRGRPGKSVMPIGLRGVGKTVRLNTFIEIAEDEGLKAGYLEASETGDLARLLPPSDARSCSTSTGQAMYRAPHNARSAHWDRSRYNLLHGSSVSLNIDALAGVADSGSLKRI